MSSIMRHKVDNVNHAAADEVFDAIHALMHLYRGRQYRLLRESAHDITHLEDKVLGFFARHPGAMAGDLATHSGRDKAQIARLVTGLKERGLLEAQVDDTDRRKIRLHLSEAGRQLQRDNQRALSTVARQSLEGLSDAERQQLLALLQRVRANLADGDGSG